MIVLNVNEFDNIWTVDGYDTNGKKLIREGTDTKLEALEALRRTVDKLIQEERADIAGRMVPWKLAD